MNRLILIGNGFDLAHGMKTSYLDFIIWLMKEAEDVVNQKGSYSDVLMSMKSAHPSVQDIYPERYVNPGEFIRFLLHGRSRPASAPVLWKIRHAFTNRLFHQCHSCGWVDIELEYYDALRRVIHSSRDREKQLEELNMIFGTLRESLERYLSTLTVPSILPDYEQVLFSKQSYNRTLFLNFNYTSTLDSFVIGRPGYGINNIHGRLKDRDNPIIFGYGDDLDDDYKLFEKERNNGFLKFAKSIGYVYSDHYRQLNNFLRGQPYEMYVMGHSCGLTDRTMLNMIFEHPNCREIKVFYHQKDGKNNFQELSQQISRHFRDKHAFRTRMVPYKNCMAMPQAR